MNLNQGGYGGFSYITENRLEYFRYNKEHVIKMAILGNIKIKHLCAVDENFKKNLFLKKSKAAKIRWSKGDLKPTFLGRNHTEDTKKKMSEIMKDRYNGSKNPNYGNCWITKEGDNKLVKKEDLQTWLNQGWEKGRKIKIT